jgi:hypothetical protein
MNEATMSFDPVAEDVTVTGALPAATVTLTTPNHLSRTGL